MAILYIVATPIGNLEDITLRALNILKNVDGVICEDTRMTARLLNKYEIKKPLISYNAHSTEAKSEQLIGLLEEGKNLALVTDAGTPGISDPGCLIVKEVRDHFKKGEVTVMPIPGASALTAALSASGLPSSDFLFLGFLPHKKGRQTLFKEIADSERTVVFYESPHRILKTLEALNIHLEAELPSNRKVVVARELTKVFEEIVSGTPEEVLNYFKGHPEKVRGEFVVMVESFH
ncbi:MAG TPA: 16S rRNA (cytidine(1402)-2'-O)-methyltransferase [Candidatus Paceibacterota bacterium]